MFPFIYFNTKLLIVNYFFQDESPDFEPESSGSDDEETINKEEEDLDENEQNEEIKLLQQESEMSLEDFLETLPPEILNSSSLSDSKLEESADPKNQVSFVSISLFPFLIVTV